MDRNDLRHDITDLVYIDGRTLDRCVDIHGGSGIQTYHSGDQHAAFQNEFVFVGRERNTLQEPFHHIVPHEKLCVCRIFSGEVIDQILELSGCFYHSSTSR